MRAGLVLAAALAVATPLAAANGQVQIGARANVAGDVYTFSSEAQFVQNDDSGRATQNNVQLFRLTVLAVEPDGLKLRYELVSGRVTDSAGASMGALVKAATNEPLDFHVRRDGVVTSVENWPAYREMLLTKIDAALPAGDAVRTLLHERLKDPDAAEMILGDVTVMAHMEPHGAVKLGRLESGRASTEIQAWDRNCTIKISRSDSSGATGVGQAVVADAVVAIEDGRVLTLSQHRVTRASGGTQDETVAIRRMSPLPVCLRQ